MLRFLILTLGPPGVVFLAYLLAAPRLSLSYNSNIHRHVVRRVDTGTQYTESDNRSGGPAHRRPSDHGSLASRCDVAARQLRQQCPSRFEVIVRPPFVLAGDFSSVRLNRLYQDVIAPVTRALKETYFEQPNQAADLSPTTVQSPKRVLSHRPDISHRPVLIVVCSTEECFRDLARQWDGHRALGYHGYYQRNKHRILLDLEAGNGSLAHELTHALTHVDCEHLPEWFDEGLGAMHEEATYSGTGRRLIGLGNWRCEITRQLLKSRRLPRLAELASPERFRSGDVGHHYAVARSWCLFLQSRKLLPQYYRLLKTRPASDEQGLTALCQVLDVDSLTTAEQEFCDWLAESKRESQQSGSR